MANPQVPKGLGPNATKVWKETVQAFDLRADELMILESACRELDVIDLIQEDIDAEGFEVRTKGSMGQPATAPELDSIRQHRAQFASLIRSLKLPEEEAPKNRSTTAREAANARWRRGA